jgi:hypothetical protein
MVRILYSVPLMYYCSVLSIVYVTLPTGIGPIAVGNKYIIYIYIYCAIIIIIIIKLDLVNCIRGPYE